MRKSIGLKIMVPFCILAIVCGLCSKDCTDESGNQVD